MSAPAKEAQATVLGEQDELDCELPSFPLAATKKKEGKQRVVDDNEEEDDEARDLALAIKLSEQQSPATQALSPQPASKAKPNSSLQEAETLAMFAAFLSSSFEEAKNEAAAHQPGDVIRSKEDGAVMIVLELRDPMPWVTRDMLTQFFLEKYDFDRSELVIPAKKRRVKAGEWAYLAHQGRSLRARVHEVTSTGYLVHVVLLDAVMEVPHARVWPDWAASKYKTFRWIRKSQAHKTFRVSSEFLSPVVFQGIAKYRIEQVSHGSKEKHLVSAHYLDPIEIDESDVVSHSSSSSSSSVHK